MSLPLAALRRYATRVLFDDGFTRASDRQDEPGTSTTRIAFRTPHEAASYLRYWKGDPGAMPGLRNTLHRYRPDAIRRLSDEEVIEALAVHLARGDVVATAEGEAIRPSTAGIIRPRRAAGQAEQAPIRPAASPARPPEASLLPQLEEVQIAGARVLPEVLQTLEQIDLTLDQIGLAAVSLEPVPSGISAIESALRLASGSIDASLDEL